MRTLPPCVIGFPCRLMIAASRFTLQPFVDGDIVAIPWHPPFDHIRADFDNCPKKGMQQPVDNWNSS